jgi:WD40 repeat protein
MVRRLDSDWSAQMTVGGSINNALCITKQANGQVRILICNNDETIKIYSLPDLQRITSLSFPTAVNYASVSPDGTKMVVVGDTSQVYLYHISSNGTYEKVSSMTGSGVIWLLVLTQSMFNG